MYEDRTGIRRRCSRNGCGDLIGEDNAVRVIDAFVDSLDLKALGFARIEVKGTGRPPYHPGDLLKLYLYGYMYRICQFSPI
jgi:transposase